MVENKPLEQKPNGLFTATCVIYLITLVSFVLLRIVTAMGLFDGLSDQANDIIFGILSQIILMFAVPVIGMKIYRKRTTPEAITFADFVRHGNPNDGGVLANFGFKKTTTSIIMWTILLGVIMFFFNIMTSVIFNSILTMFGHRGASSGGSDMPYNGVAGLIITLILVSVLPGVCEETSHRGLLMRGFLARIGIMNTVVLTALLFGLMHLNIVQFFYASILGYFMALTVLATRTIWTAVILHMMNNGLSIYFSFASENGWLGGDVMNIFGNFLGGMSILFFFIFFWALYYFIVMIIHKFARENFIDRFKNETVRPPLHRTRGLLAIKYYLTMGEKINRQPLNPLEKTLILGIIFLGATVTGMTLLWGFL